MNSIDGTKSSTVRNNGRSNGSDRINDGRGYFLEHTTESRTGD